MRTTSSSELEQVLAKMPEQLDVEYWEADGGDWSDVPEAHLLRTATAYGYEQVARSAGGRASLFRRSSPGNRWVRFTLQRVTSASTPTTVGVEAFMKQAKVYIEDHPEETLAPAEITAAAQWMRNAYAADQLQAVWERRLAGGFGAAGDGVSQEDWFWYNALPALSALRLGLKAHPLVATCCGWADGDVDRTDPEQVITVQEFEAMFFAE